MIVCRERSALPSLPPSSLTLNGRKGLSAGDGVLEDLQAGEVLVREAEGREGGREGGKGAM
jgi:hypothetical protein